MKQLVKSYDLDELRTSAAASVQAPWVILESNSSTLRIGLLGNGLDRELSVDCDFQATLLIRGKLNILLNSVQFGRVRGGTVMKLKLISR